ncbi:GH1 family beta-glucosidase [Nibricoccus sp. IMCC34717]|uniref:GH1 family beta-glucosidase n=1 Tax=Nibricoccus sp. IMCC34717 TaxID=3034021 RepID=UPI00384A94B3
MKTYPKVVLSRKLPLRLPTFPKGFIWGVATAAPQIEGAAWEDGKGASVWDEFARKPGAIADGDTLDVACDHYHRFRQDFALMRKLGVKNYRLSLAWPRIYPDGNGTVNEKGLAYYDRLIDCLLANGITPWVTFFHWDLPQALEERGGWRSRVVVEAFAKYADTVVKRYGDRVKNWITLNEIHCFTILAYGGGGKAPGTNEGPAVVNQTYHNAILCHGHAVRAVREHGGRGARVGLTDNSFVSVPVTETPDDIEAARKAFVLDNIRTLDPIYRGRYDEGYLRAEGKNRPKVVAGDFDLISLPTDFLGQNLYSGSFVRAGKNGKVERLPFPAQYQATALHTWLRLVPQAIYWGPRNAAEIYGVKDIIITENGAGFDEDYAAGEQVPDTHRRDYVRTYLRELHRAIGDGVPVKGYFLWSFMDNFEWQDGYSKRFGIVRVDYKTQKRTPKLSALWYSEVMRANAIV